MKISIIFKLTRFFKLPIVKCLQINFNFKPSTSNLLFLEIHRYLKCNLKIRKLPELLKFIPKHKETSKDENQKRSNFNLGKNISPRQSLVFGLLFLDNCKQDNLKF